MMNLTAVTTALRTRLHGMPTFGCVVKFEFYEGGIVCIDGHHEPMRVNNIERDADCTLRLSYDDFARLEMGAVHPVIAFASGAIMIEGDYHAAAKIPPLFERRDLVAVAC